MNIKKTTQQGHKKVAEIKELLDVTGNQESTNVHSTPIRSVHPWLLKYFIT